MQNTLTENKQKSNMRSRMGRPAKGKTPKPSEPSVIGEVDVQSLGAMNKAAPKPAETPNKEASAPAATSAKPEDSSPRRAPRRQNASRRSSEKKPEERGPRQPREPKNEDEERGSGEQRRSSSRRRRPRHPSGPREDTAAKDSDVHSRGRNRRRVEEKPVEGPSNEIYYEPPRRSKIASTQKATAPSEEKGWVKSLLSSVFGFGAGKKAAQPKAEASKEGSHAPKPRFMEGEKPPSRSRGRRGRGRGRRGPNSAPRES